MAGQGWPDLSGWCLRSCSQRCAAAAAAAVLWKAVGTLHDYALVMAHADSIFAPLCINKLRRTKGLTGRPRYGLHSLCCAAFAVARGRFHHSRAAWAGNPQQRGVSEAFAIDVQQQERVLSISRYGGKNSRGGRIL